MQEKISYPVELRNSTLLKLFIDLGFNARLIGNPNQPKIIIDNSFAISGFVKNSLYNFTSKPFNGFIIETINIYSNCLSRNDVLRLIESSEKRRLWKVAIIDDNVDELQYYVKTEDDVAHFSLDDARFFFTIESAISCQQYLTQKYSKIFSVSTFE